MCSLPAPVQLAHGHSKAWNSPQSSSCVPGLTLCALSLQNRIGAVSQLQYELGKVLCDVHSWDGVVIAG